jgi:hypothetical protein
VDRLARIIFPYYWEVLSFVCAVGEWMLWCWAFGAPASPIAHLAAFAVLVAGNRLAAVGYSHEDGRAPCGIAWWRDARRRLRERGWRRRPRRRGDRVVAPRPGRRPAARRAPDHTPFEWLCGGFRVVGWLGVRDRSASSSRGICALSTARRHPAPTSPFPTCRRRSTAFGSSS